MSGALAAALCAAFAVAAAQAYEVPVASAAPGLDPASALWQEAPELALKRDGREIAFQALAFEGRLFLRLSWPSKSEARAASPWTWDEKLKAYRPGEEREDAFSMRWLANGTGQAGELWTWRAGRTDPAKCVDVMSVSPSGEISFDPEEACWSQRPPNSFAGASIPRFVNRAPKGRAAKIQAKGLWDEGRWTLVVAAPAPPYGKALELKLSAEAPASTKTDDAKEIGVALEIPQETGGGAK